MDGVQLLSARSCSWPRSARPSLQVGHVLPDDFDELLYRIAVLFGQLQVVVGEDGVDLVELVVDHRRPWRSDAGLRRQQLL